MNDLANRAQPFRNPLCLALDVDSKDEAFAVLSEIDDLVGGVKIGPRLALRYGMGFLQEISDRLPVFLDCKFFDIPSTMVAAVRAAFDVGASLVTVHGLCGPEALKSLALLESELNEERPFRILVVTILTSFKQDTLPKVLQGVSIEEHVRRLAESAREAGLRGLVCSVEELSRLPTENHFVVTPGIRLTAGASGDQNRVATPREALQQGSNLLVIGRPILESKNRRELVTSILSDIYL